jgi:glycosyltransferase involved in cell wall biosynthesis
MRILLLTQWFDPEPTFKGLLFAREFAARGHDVEVLTGFPNYPGGDVYPGYRIRPWVREQIDGVSILRVALYPSHDKSAFGRVLNYTSFAISAALIGTALIRKPDVVYVYNPPATIGFPAVALGLLRRVPFVFDICDLWPDTVAVSGMLSSPGALTLLGKWCNFVYRRARHIVVVSPGFKQQLVRRGVPPDKIDVIYNWCDDAAIEPGGADPELASRLGLSGYFNVMFAGTMGTAQALDSVLEAAALCRQTLPNVQFVFVGGGVDRNRLEKKAGDLGLTNVRFLPRQPMSAMGAVLGLADVLLVHLKDHPLFGITIPSKTQAYMASGKPVLIAVRGDAAQLVTQSGGGLVCEPENPRSMAETVARFAAMSPEQRRSMGEAGKRFYDEQLSLNAGVTKFEALFAKICGVTIPASRHSCQSSEWVS